MKTKHILTLAATFFAATFTASAQVKKPISKVPFKITKPGNYYLAKDLTLPAPVGNGASTAILIDADNVSLDLNGRTLANAVAGAGTGIGSKGNQTNLRIRNGVIHGFGDGIFIGSDGHYFIEDVVVQESGQVGIWIAGGYSEVRRCTVRKTGPGSNIVQGIRIEGAFGIVEDCTVAEFSRTNANVPVTGLYLPQGELQVRRNYVESYLNAATGTTGIQAGGECLLSDNILRGWAAGLDLVTDVYRSNTAFTCTVKYSGGVDGGGNK